MALILSGDTGPSFVQSAAMPAGTVLQTVTGTTSTEVTNSGGSYTDTGLTATITPKSATSKILVLVNQVGVVKNNGNASNGIYLKLLRNGTQISLITNAAGYTGTTLVNYVGTLSTSYLDSPATTSALTYKTQFTNNTSAGTVYVQASSEATSTITLMEIAV